MSKKSIVVGIILIITMFSVLCTSIFSILTTSILQNEAAIINKVAENNANYNKANETAEDILLKIVNTNGNLENVEYTQLKDKQIAHYSVSIDENKQLDVDIEMNNEVYKVIKWEQVYTGDWEPDYGINLWDGQS